jgi:hypothetical protein
MANFTTHIAVGTVVSGALATLTLAADVVAPENLIAVTMAGVLGSVLPDIDLKDSRPSRAMFSGLAIFFSFAVLFNAAMKFSIAELWILWLGTLLIVRYGLHAVFHRMSVHRGIWHSILAAVFCAVATAVVFQHLMNKPAGVAWLGGAFMFAGYITHLTLDEIYSVDVMDTRLKSSFGTALKFIDQRHFYSSLAMAAATLGAIVVSPPTATFIDGLGSRSLWSGLEQRLLPRDKWFGLVETPRLARRHDEGKGAGVVTGSVGQAPTAEPAPATETPVPAPVPAVVANPAEAPGSADAPPAIAPSATASP